MEETGVQLLQGDVRAVLQTLPAESVHCVVTSPPYYALRDYGTGEWEGGDENCDHKAPRTGGPNPERYTNGGGEMFRSANDKRYRDICGKCGARRVDQQIGLESSPAEYLETMVDVFREVKRVLRPDGVCCVNMGDCYVSSPNGRSAADTKALGKDDRTFRDKPWANFGGLAPKNLMMMPSRLAIALQADGWILRSMLSWIKRSAMPESATDRPSTAVEYVFIFSRSPRYYWDADAVRRRQDSMDPKHPSYRAKLLDGEGYTQTGVKWQGAENEGNGYYGPERKFLNANGRNLRNSDFYFDSLDLAIEATRSELAHLLHLRERGGLLLDGEGEPLALDVNPEALRDQHFASFPTKLVAPLIQAGTSEWGVCSQCGAPYVRQVEKTGHVNNREPAHVPGNTATKVDSTGWAPTTRGTNQWQSSCKCEAEVTPATILDPFCGSGTTMKVATKLGRRSIGIELSEQYLGICRRRNSQLGLLL